MVVVQQGEVFSELSDGQLAQCFLEGDEYAFEVLVKRYSHRLFNFIFHLLGDYDCSCDILQQVLLQFYVSLPSLYREQSFKPWLYQVARYRVIDETRRKRLSSLSDMEGEEEGTLIGVTPVALPENEAEYRELQQRLLKAITTLPERFQSIVTLRYLEQLTFSEIGSIVGVPESTAKTYFQRAKPLLRAALQVKHVFELLPEA